MNKSDFEIYIFLKSNNTFQNILNNILVKSL